MTHFKTCKAMTKAKNCMIYFKTEVPHAVTCPNCMKLLNKLRANNLKRINEEKQNFGRRRKKKEGKR
jgi:hypothetical protein